MKFDFDTIIERRGSDSLKWRGCDDTIPMWVADMDFAAPPCVLDAMRRRVDHGVFGYSVPTKQVNQAVVDWAERRYGWRIAPDWLVWLPGLVSGLHVAAMALAGEGEEIATFVPVYPPFLAAPPTTGRRVQTVRLAQENGRWSMDLEELEKAITPQTRVLFFCHPHNPVGRAFRSEELKALAELCARRDLLVCSDEIHCDLILEPGRHVPFASLDPEIASRTVTLMSPSKTFNLSGLGCGYAVISNPELRSRFRAAAHELIPYPNAMGYAACRAAYEEGEPWRLELLEYLQGNRDYLAAFFAEKLPEFRVSHVEATYLAWIDSRCLGERNRPTFFEAAGVRLSDGAPFHGPGFMRLNFGCPRATLQEALARIHRAVRSEA